MASKLDQLREMTIVVADTGDVDAVRRLKPQDCTTNPSIVLKAVGSDYFRDTVSAAVGKGGDAPDIAERLTVAVGAELAGIVPGRVSTEVDARLSFDTRASVAKAHRLIDAYAARAPLSVWYAKIAGNTGMQMDLEPALELERHLTASLFTTRDRSEGMSAFMEKREAEFKGR